MLPPRRSIQPRIAVAAALGAVAISGVAFAGSGGGRPEAATSRVTTRAAPARLAAESTPRLQIDDCFPNCQGANLQHAYAALRDYSGGNFAYAHLENTHFIKVNFAGANFEGAYFIDARIARSNFTGAIRLSYQRLHTSHIKCNAYLGSTGWPPESDRGSCTDAVVPSVNPGIHGCSTTCVGAALQGISIPGAHFGHRDFSRADLAQAKLIGTYLAGAKFESTNLEGANLLRAILSDANLTGANLTGAKLAHANLMGANLMGANLTGANLTGANLTGANLTGANLTGVKWLGATCPNGAKTHPHC